MRVLVIGGTGLISSAIVAKLLERGDDVWIISRGQSSRPLPEGTRHIAADRSQPQFVDRIAEAPMFDCTIDMVCYDPAEAELALRALRGRTGHYILTSTIDVYRKPASRYPYLESEPYGGIGTYALNKVACEKIMRGACDDGFPVTIIRPAATYGDRHLPVHSLGRGTAYLDRLRRGKPIIQHGDGSSFWVSCHAHDVATAFLGATGNERAFGRSYHVTGEEWVTWNEHHRVLAAAIGAPEPTLVHIPTDTLVRLAGDRAQLVRDNFQFNNIFDNSAARRDLGFEYTITLADGFPAWFASLEDAGMIDDSDADPFDDALVKTWTTLGLETQASLQRLR